MQLRIILFLIFFIFATSFIACVSEATTYYSDSLVKDLDCRKVNSREIYTKIRQSAFSSFYHLPLANWSFSAGLYDLAACWSLSRTQRLSFYLSRWSETSESDFQKMTFDILEMVRGSSPYSQVDDTLISEWPLKDFLVLKIPDSRWDISSALWASITKGFTQDFPNNLRLQRNLKNDIEFYQNRRFHDFIRNIKYVIGDGNRSPADNIATKNILLQNLEYNKLTLLLLRPKRTSQHIVVAKKFEIKPSGEIDIFVFDSNYPFQDQVITFNKSNSSFYAPEIIRGLPEVEDPFSPVGLFVVDEGERSLIEKTLVKYYKKVCLK